MNIKQRIKYLVGKKLAGWISEAEQLARKETQAQLLSKARKCGKGVRINGSIAITGIESVEIGNNVHIGNCAHIRAEGGLTIGDNTHISRNFVLYTINHNHLGSRLPFDETMIPKPVSIGRNVWIGMNVCIAPGTTIGDGTIIGMGATVSGTVPAFAIIGNQKWRELGRRDTDHYKRLDREQSYGGRDGLPLGE